MQKKFQKNFDFNRPFVDYIQKLQQTKDRQSLNRILQIRSVDIASKI